MLNFYVDGSCTKNGGGYGVICIIDNKIEYMYSEQCKDTTNNKEELKALISISALNHVESRMVR